MCIRRNMLQNNPILNKHYEASQSYPTFRKLNGIYMQLQNKYLPTNWWNPVLKGTYKISPYQQIGGKQFSKATNQYSPWLKQSYKLQHYSQWLKQSNNIAHGSNNPTI